MKLKEIIMTHHQRYPKWQITDLVKLIYQNEFGCGHYISDQEASFVRLKKELDSLSSEDFQTPLLFENLGNGYSRLHLNSTQASLSAKIINQLFLITATIQAGSKGSFEDKLGHAFKLCEKGLLPFNTSDLGKYLKEYEKEGYPPVSHSQDYKETYNPSYRVVSSIFDHYFPILQNIDLLLQTSKKSIIVAIDGSAGSGKSTLAGLLNRIYGCPIISMDHFFLQPEQRTKERLAEPGGNVDYERFQKEVLSQLKSYSAFKYRIYNCQSQSFTWSKVIERHPLTIVEGSYSMHPKLRDNYDLRVFLDIDPRKQQQRILARNGPEMFKSFVNEWIPLENEYFKRCQVEEESDLVFTMYKEPLFFG